MRLSDKKNNAPIPYRDSKLTRLLQPALEGDSKVSIICNISPCSDAYDETLSTLKFAQRAKKIKQIIVKNDVTDSKALIIKYQQEIQELQDRLREMEIKMAQEEKIADSTVVIDELISLKSDKIKAEENLAIISQEKVQLQKELERLKSFIIHADDVKIPKITHSESEEKNKNEIDSVVKTPIMRYSTSISKRPSRANSECNTDFFKKKDEENTESLLIKEIDNIESELDLGEPFKNKSIIGNQGITLEECLKIIEQQSKYIEEMNQILVDQDEIFKVIREKDEEIINLKKTIEEKDEAYELLSDELELCKNNLTKLQVSYRLKSVLKK